METVDHFKNAIRNWISWTETHCALSKDYLLLRTDLDDETDQDEVEPWIDDLDAAFDAQGVSNGSFREAAEKVLAEDPLNIRARYVILDYLRSIVNAEWIGIPEDIEVEKNEARHLISYILPLAPVEAITDWPRVTWEVGQAGQNSDHDRAMRLFEHALAADLAPRQEIQLLRARHLFLAVYIDSIRDIWKTEFKVELSISGYGSQFVWHPSLGIHHVYQAVSNLVIISFCQDVRKLRTDLEEREKTFLRQAVADIQNSPGALEGNRNISARVLPACLFSLGRNSEAADAYKFLLLKSTPNTNPERIPVLRSIALCYESGGDLRKADSVLQKLQEAFPTEKGVRSKRADLFQRQADFARAYQMLREEADLDPNVSEQPYASLALSLGEIAHDRSAGDLSSAIARRFLERNPAVGSMIDALHDEYWPTYTRLSVEARDAWRMGTTQLHYFSAIEPSQGSKAMQEGIRNSTISVELEIRSLFIEFRKLKQQAWGSEPANDFAARIESDLQGKFVKAIRSSKPELRLTLGEMCGLLSCHPKTRCPLLNEFHAWLQGHCPSLVGKVRLVEDVNRVRNPATHASIDPGQAKELIVKCQQILTAIRGC